MSVTSPYHNFRGLTHSLEKLRVANASSWPCRSFGLDIAPSSGRYSRFASILQRWIVECHYDCFHLMKTCLLGPLMIARSLMEDNRSVVVPNELQKMFENNYIRSLFSIDLTTTIHFWLFAARRLVAMSMGTDLLCVVRSWFTRRMTYSVRPA